MHLNPEPPDGTDLPRFAQWDVRLVLLLTFLMQLYSWWRLDGYQLADSVEYIERAQGFLFGHEVLGPSSVRSFAFSALFLPFYWAADQLGIADTRGLVYVFRVGTALLGLALCLSCMRLGARFGGRTAGVWTGLLVGANPVFLQYSISPVSGVAAALCVSLGLERCLVRGSTRQHVFGGAWLGVGFMMAYQTLPIAGALVIALFARDRFRHFRTTGGTLLGFSGGLAGQVFLDRLSYGEWGSSIFRYVLDNVGGILVRILGKYLNMREAARAVYSKIEEFHARDFVAPTDTSSITFQSIQSPDWYYENLSSAIVWPVLVLLAIGLLRSIWRPRWNVFLLVFCLALNAVLLAQKPSKSFRLWLPLIPFIFPLCAVGLELLRGKAEAFLPLSRRAVTTLLVLLTPLLGVLALNRLETRKFGIFWEATEWVNRTVEARQASGQLVRLEDPPVSPEGYGAGKIRVSGSYHWAMFMRESPLTFLVKLPFTIDSWEGLDAAQKQRNVDKLLSLDWYITHWPALQNHPDWMAIVNEAFTVEAAFYDRDADRGLAAVYVLKRKPSFARSVDESARTFHSLLEYTDERDYLERHSFSTPVDFVDPESDAYARLLGWNYETLPGTGLGWVSYHWLSNLEDKGEWVIVDEITSPDSESAWRNDHSVANGLVSLAALPEGSVLRESHLVVPGKDAFSIERPFVPLGGPYLAGDLIPCELWLKIIRYDESGKEVAYLIARDALSGQPRPDSPNRMTARGWQATVDRLTRVGSFLLPRSDGLVPRFVPPIAEELPAAASLERADLGSETEH